MNTNNERRGIIRRALIQFAVAAGIVGLAAPASAFVLDKATSCSPGQKWHISRPVKVRLLGDSVFDYLDHRGAASSLSDLGRIDCDVKAVIDLYDSRTRTTVPHQLRERWRVLPQVPARSR